MEGTNGDEWTNATCPLCGESDWANTPAPVLLPQASDPTGGFGLAVQAHVCNGCGFVALVSLKKAHD